MKRVFLFYTIPAVVLLGAVIWFPYRPGPIAVAAAESKPAGEEGEAGPQVTRDAKGNVVLTISDEMQGDIGIQVTNPAPLQLSPEKKAYGRVLDPAPLVALANELAGDQAAALASENELARLKTLEGSGNASARALQAAEAAARRDQLAVDSAKDRLALSWGKALAEQADLPAFVATLTSLDSVLVRLDLPAGEAIATPSGARMESLAIRSADGEFLGKAPAVDPQMQGRGFLFRIRANAGRFSPGEAVTGFLKVPGEPLSGVVVPRDAVVRTEGAGWVYVLNKSDGEHLVRTAIALDHPIEAGWFVTNGVTAHDYVVVSGAQQLLSTELKGQGGGE